jgi:hypothetical protein
VQARRLRHTAMTNAAASHDFAVAGPWPLFRPGWFGKKLGSLII